MSMGGFAARKSLNVVRNVERGQVSNVLLRPVRREGGEEGGYNLKGAWVLVVSLRGINCGFQVSLGVFTTEYRYFYALKYLLGLHSKK